MRAYDLEHGVVHEAAYTEELVTFQGDVVAAVLGPTTVCGLGTMQMCTDVDVGPAAFNYDECQVCFG